MQAARTHLIVRVVSAADPGLSPEVIGAAVERVAAGMPVRGRLADYLAAHPEALTTGGSRGPKVVGSLIAVLVEAGSEKLVLPRCAECDRPVKLLFPRPRADETDGRTGDGTDGVTSHRTSDGTQERICETCWRRGNIAECVQCRRLKPIAGRTATGGPLCSSCDRLARAKPCSRCDRVKPVAKHDSEGQPICGACKRLDSSTWEACVQCQRRRPVSARAQDGGALCSRCYIPPSRTCTRCGQQAPVAAFVEGEPWCMRCYRQPERKCGRCGRIRRIKVRGRDGQPDLCGSCHRAPVLICGVCGIEDLCLRTTADRSPICFHCHLVRRVDELLSDPTGNIATALVPLREAILAGHNPHIALTWLRRSPVVPVLTAMARGELPLTHATLDAAAGHKRGGAFAIEHLRQLLISCGALPDRDRHLARLEIAITRLLDDAHVEDQKLLRTYTTWWLLPRLRRSAEQGKPTQYAAHRVREQAAEAARFLAWLREHSTPLARATQADVDAWLTIRPQARRRLPGFLRWSRAQRLLLDVDADYPPARDPSWFITDDHRWAMARRFLTDDHVPVRDRVAALLLLLYGQTTARITRLSRADIQHEEGQVLLRLGADAVRLPPPLDELAQQLPEQVPAGMAGRLADADQWLFPGRRPGHPMDATGLAKRLRDLGIPLRAARNTALLQLGAELPSIVLADLLGIHISTAEAWSAAAGARWTTYAGSTR